MQNYLIALFAFIALVAVVISYVRQRARRAEADNWPISEGRIQSVGKVVVNAGRTSYSVDVGDFSYNVNGEYYSGRLTISDSSPAVDGSTKVLVNQKIQVRYDPLKPAEFCIFPQKVGGFSLSPYVETFATDVDPIDLNLDKI